MRRIALASALVLGACASLVGIEEDFPRDAVKDAGSDTGNTVDAPIDAPPDANPDAPTGPNPDEYVCCGCVKEPVAGAENELFKDVGPTAAEAAAVAKLYGEGVISGCESSPPLFCPTCELSRSTLAKWVVLAKRIPLIDKSSPTYLDVPKNHPAYAYIETMFDKKYMIGYEDGTFRPDSSVTRGVTAVILANARYENDVPEGTGQTFGDVPPGSFPYDAVEAFADACVTTGCNTEGTLFCPEKLITRRAAVIMVARALQSFGLTCVPDGG
jgi:hypothetical protein